MPKKMLKQAGDDQKAWLQFMEAKQCARLRASRDAPSAQERTLREDDEWRQEVYAVAAERISAILQDPDHYMKNNINKVETSFKVRPERPHGRLDVLRSMINMADGPGKHKWQVKGKGIQCGLCGLHVKGCPTHAETTAKQESVCPGERTKTLQQIMDDMISASDELPDGHEGHRYYCKPSSFDYKRFWLKVPRRCAKEALQRLADTKCEFGPVAENELNLRVRVHLQHELVQRQQWLECLKCRKASKIVDGKVQAWLVHECPGVSTQTQLTFAPSSSS